MKGISAPRQATTGLISTAERRQMEISTAKQPTRCSSIYLCTMHPKWQCSVIEFIMCDRAVLHLIQSYLISHHVDAFQLLPAWRERSWQLIVARLQALMSSHHALLVGNTNDRHYIMRLYHKEMPCILCRAGVKSFWPSVSEAIASLAGSGSTCALAFSHTLLKVVNAFYNWQCMHVTE